MNLVSIKNNIIKFLYLLIILFCCSCIKPLTNNNKTVIEPNIVNASQDSLKDLVLNVELRDKIKVKYGLQEIDWDNIDFEKGATFNITSDLIKDTLTIKTSLTAIKIPIEIRLYKDDGKLKISVLQLFNTIFEDVFIFEYNNTDKSIRFEEAISIMYTHQAKDIICKYAIERQISNSIDIRNEESINCNEVAR